MDDFMDQVAVRLDSIQQYYNPHIAELLEQTSIMLEDSVCLA